MGEELKNSLRSYISLSHQELKADKSKNSGKCILPKVKEVTI